MTKREAINGMKTVLPILIELIDSGNSDLECYEVLVEELEEYTKTLGSPQIQHIFEHLKHLIFKAEKPEGDSYVC